MEIDNAPVVIVVAISAETTKGASRIRTVLPMYVHKSRMLYCGSASIAKMNDCRDYDVLEAALNG